MAEWSALPIGKFGNPSSTLISAETFFGQYIACRFELKMNLNLIKFFFKMEFLHEVDATYLAENK